MTANQIRRDAEIRETYTEHVLADGALIGMIFDPENSNAWIQSNVTVSISGSA